jgi:hypothetical protein
VKVEAAGSSETFVLDASAVVECCECTLFEGFKKQ